MLAALDVLAGQTGAKLAILGRMGELGDAHDAGHRAVGAAAARLGLPVIAVGPLAAGIAAACPGALHVVDAAAAVAAARTRLAAPTAILVKASRSAALERVVNGLLEGAC
jgi:UDP-N-acetylmuramoyl-tripeptide--D-alanyl-D-alanine ligase